MIKTIFKLIILIACFVGVLFIALEFLELVKIIDWTNWRIVGFLGVITLIGLLLVESVKSLFSK